MMTTMTTCPDPPIWSRNRMSCTANEQKWVAPTILQQHRIMRCFTVLLQSHTTTIAASSDKIATRMLGSSSESRRLVTLSILKLSCGILTRGDQTKWMKMAGKKVSKNASGHFFQKMCENKCHSSHHQLQKNMSRAWCNLSRTLAWLDITKLLAIHSASRH